MEISKFAKSIKDIDNNTPFVEQLALVLMEMADCEDIPANITNPLLRQIFDAADTSEMSDDMKEQYKSSIFDEADYEYHMESARNLKAGGAPMEMIISATGLTKEEVEDLNCF